MLLSTDVLGGGQCGVCLFYESKPKYSMLTKSGEEKTQFL
jgi:hypothetical protein